MAALSFVGCLPLRVPVRVPIRAPLRDAIRGSNEVFSALNGSSQSFRNIGALIIRIGFWGPLYYTGAAAPTTVGPAGLIPLVSWGSGFWVVQLHPRAAGTLRVQYLRVRRQSEESEGLCWLLASVLFQCTDPVVQLADDSNRSHFLVPVTGPFATELLRNLFENLGEPF